MKSFLVGLGVFVMFFGTVQADEASVAEGLSKVIPNVKKESVSKTPIDGLYQVIVGARV